MKFCHLFVFASLLICTSAYAGAPVNLIPNGNFATSIDGWTCNATCFWTNLGSGSDGTGAIDIPPVVGVDISSSCFAIQPQTVYDLSFDGSANIGPAGGEFELHCSAFHTTDCTQEGGSESIVPLYYSIGPAWVNSGRFQQVTQPNEHSAQCDMNAYANGGEMRIDNILFTFNRELDLFADGFDGSP
jgi:hypothetical protein